MPELRHAPDGALDEIVAACASLHLERLSGTEWFLVVEQDGRRVQVWLRSARRIEAVWEEGAS